MVSPLSLLWDTTSPVGGGSSKSRFVLDMGNTRCIPKTQESQSVTYSNIRNQAKILTWPPFVVWLHTGFFLGLAKAQAIAGSVSPLGFEGSTAIFCWAKIQWIDAMVAIFLPRHQCHKRPYPRPDIILPTIALRF